MALSIIIGSSCTKLPIYQSADYDEDSFNKSFYKFYDADSKIRYDVFHDDDKLYLRLNTSDRNAIMKIMMGGLFLYFDSTGKKKQNVYMNFPLPGRGGGLSLDGRNEKIQKKNRSVSIEKRRNLFPPHAVFQNTDGKQVFEYKKGLEGIEIDVNMDSTGNFNYYLSVPFAKLFSNALKKDDEISIGIISGEVEMPANSGSMGPGNGMSGRRGEGMPHGGGRNQGSGMRSQGNMGQAGMMQQKSDPIKIWFKVQFNTE